MVNHSPPSHRAPRSSSQKVAVKGSSFALHWSAQRSVIAVAMAAVMAGCGAAPESTPTPTDASPAAAGTSTGPSAEAPAITGLGEFPEFPDGPLPDDVAALLQAVLDTAIEQGGFRGATAAVVVAGTGSWSGAAGVGREGNPLTPDTPLLTASTGKTVTAAQVLRLVEEEKLGLDDPAADHLPSDIAFADTNDATIREVLGMRSGIPEPPNYIANVDNGYTVAELLNHTRQPSFSAGSEFEYVNMNYILLGSIVEQVTERPFWEALHSGVLDRPGLDGLAYGEKSALAADGWKIEATSASLARWGYELYGGFVLSDESLAQMTDFPDGFYGLGTINFSSFAEYLTPAIGHGGFEPSNAVKLVAFPEQGVVIAVQANANTGDGIDAVAGALKDAILRETSQ